MAKVKRKLPAIQVEGVIKELVIRFNPRKVILFGSYAYGEPDEESDVDLLVVTSNPPPREEKWKVAYELVEQFSCPLQIIFMTPEEFEETRDVVGGVAYPAHQWGRVLYEPSYSPIIFTSTRLRRRPSNSP